ncbi:hypothetical protein E4U24_007390 [Claviceps purpurea]|nr:hypothetical protein E4U28_003923 [Claviceps purpurea]KAG6164351.1 hypothetical protein E4U51_005135 [Claviceps purpurea]KAG6200370.1 hypothetical protein E4U10_002686 [Claviceps purpurea]KAG6217880.1 hypothetical protein E4U50_002733 [Claviceps purpurea]KAG6237715.1 hypothetical protein E4U24_007390 [Claviceps purpurea]
MGRTANIILGTTLGIITLFSATGVLLIIFSYLAKSQIGNTARDGHEVIRLSLYETFPLAAGFANGGLVLAASVVVLLGVVFAGRRRWLQMGGYLVIVCGVYSLCLGVYLWVMTLKLKRNFFGTYLGLRPSEQALVQESFQCCGYYNATTPAFVTDAFCSSPAAAALIHGCGAGISSYGNLHIGNFFTALFGMVGVDAVLILSIACLLKDRKERERYRHIDEKSGFRTF